MIKQIKLLLLFLFAVAVMTIPPHEVKTAEAYSTDLLIRSVYHNSTNDNMLEVFNGTNAAVNLSNYYVSVYHNGNPTPTATHRLSNIDLPIGKAFLLGKDSSTGPYTAAERAYVNSFQFKLLLPNGTGLQNAAAGNDAYALRKDSVSGTIIDVFGMIGYSPGEKVGWTEHNSDLRYGYVDPSYVLDPVTKPGATNWLSSLIRRPDVVNPQVSSLTYKSQTRAQSFKPSEWGVYNVETFAGNIYRFNLFDDVNDVIRLISLIPNPVTVNSGNAITDARTAYDNLTESQKLMVTNYTTLTSAELSFEGFARIAAVIELIDELPDPVTLADEADVLAARTAFDALSDEEKLQVTNAEELIEAEERIADIKITNPIVAAIQALPDVITLTNATEVESLRSQYENLTLDQQALITNYNRLLDAELTIASIRRVNNVQALISELPNPISLDDAVDIAQARTAFNALTEAEQLDITNINVLVEAENRLLNLQAAHQVQLRIAELSNPITLADETEVSETRQAFESLTDVQQGFVTNEQTLITAESIIESLLDAIDATIFAIQGIPNLITILSQSQIETVRETYDALDTLQQERVTNATTLFAAEAELAIILDRIQNVIDLIDAMVDPITLAQEEAYLTAQAAFDALSSDEQTFVTNKERLILIGEKILDLNTPRYVVYYVIFNSIFTEIVKSGTGLNAIPVNPTRLGFTFTGWVIEGTTTLIDDLSTYIVTNITRLVAQFEINPQDPQSELIVDIDGLDEIDITTLYPYPDVAIELKVEPIAREVANEADLESIDESLTNNVIYNFENMFILDLTIEVTFTENGQSVTRNLDVLNEPITIEIKIPNDYQRFASYQVVRVHDNETDFLDTTYQPSTNTLTFDTDRFSTYGVLYSNALVDDLMDLINAIPQPPTLSDRASIEAIRAAYNDLTPEQQAMILNLSLLEDAEEVIAALMAEVNAVIALIDAFPEVNLITLNNDDQIVAARAAYEALTSDQKALVTNYQDLLDAEAKIAQLKQALIDQEAANVVIDLIDAFPELNLITLNDEDQIAAARTAYDELTPAQQALVTNYQDLLDAEEKIASLKQAMVDQEAANVVIDMIDGFPELDLITLNDEDQIVAARTAYDALTEDQQALVTNYQELVDAEAKLASLNNQPPLTLDFSLLPYHLLGGLLIFIGYFIKQRKKA